MTISNQASGVRPGICTSTTRPTTPYIGQLIYETDTANMYLWSGSVWQLLAGGVAGPWAVAQPIRSITTGTDIPTIADKGDLIIVNTSSGAVTITINSSLGLSPGERIDFLWQGAATSITFSGSGVTLNATPGLKLRARYSVASLLCTGSNTYVLAGDLIA